MLEDKAESERREQAKRESRGCSICGGDGILSVFHPRYRGDAVVYEVVFDESTGSERKRPIQGRVAAHCVCPIGRWIRERIDPDTRRRIVDVQAILEGRSAWRLERPDLDLTGMCAQRDRAVRSVS